MGLVLGGGGVVGVAFHAGALTALHHDLGYDPRDAAVIVGTSAGSLVGAVLRAGVPATDLAALTVDAPTEATDPQLAAQLTERPEFPPFGLGHLFRAPRLPSPRALLDAMSPWTPMRASQLWMAMLADGVIPLGERLEVLDGLVPDWADGSLWICAASRDGRRRVVFGRGGTPATLSQAVAASCAVPGYFEPVRIGDHRYVDGGIISPTNADVLRREALDLVIVVSPMSGRPAGGNPLTRAMRRYCSRFLEREVRRLQARGIETIVLEPGPETQRDMAIDFMSDEHRTDIVRSAFLEVGVALDRHAELLAPIAGRAAYVNR